MTLSYEETSEVLKALAHPARLKTVAGLLKDGCNVGHIQKVLGLPQSTVSQHLRVLKNAGIIKGRREGNKTCYRVIDVRVRKIMEIIKRK
ncbi:MAG: winged helix-turn-helix transcriptional regulator [Sedimentisphaerales bacterium]|nr:winged helix-turn-helix transcriptional regulator [Sedimentisphaerales bacterium]